MSRHKLEKVFTKYPGFTNVESTIKLFARYSRVRLVYESENIGGGGKREWYEVWNGERGIVIQRYSGSSSWNCFWNLYLVDGDAVEVYAGQWDDITDALSFIRGELGINVEVEV